MYLVPLFKCNAIVFTLHLRGGVKGIRVISYSLGFPHVLSIYAPLWASIQIIHSPFLICNTDHLQTETGKFYDYK